MDRFFKVIYKDYDKDSNSSFYREVVKEAIVSWGLEYYDEKISYNDNLCAICVTIFDSGFIEIKSGKIISAACILQILDSNSSQITQQKEQIKENKDQKNNKYNKNKYRKMRRFDKRNSSENAEQNHNAKNEQDFIKQNENPSEPSIIDQKNNQIDD